MPFFKAKKEMRCPQVGEEVEAEAGEAGFVHLLMWAAAYNPVGAYNLVAARYLAEG